MNSAGKLDTGLLRAMHSRNLKTFVIRSFFFKRWLLTHVLAGPKVKKPPASKLASVFRPFDPGITYSLAVIFPDSAGPVPPGNLALYNESVENTFSFTLFWRCSNEVRF